MTIGPDLGIRYGLKLRYELLEYPACRLPLEQARPTCLNFYGILRLFVSATISCLSMLKAT